MITAACWRQLAAVIWHGEYRDGQCPGVQPSGTLISYHSYIVVRGERDQAGARSDSRAEPHSGRDRPAHRHWAPLCPAERSEE